MASDDAALARLRDHVTGPVLTAGDAGWDAARTAYNLTVDQQPATVVVPADVNDVATVMRFASARGLRVAPQRTGHNAGPLGDLTQTLLLNTAAMAHVDVDPATCRARVGGGAQWGSVVPVAGEHGLVALHGSSPNLGVVGYALGGGIGWYGRRYGLACNSVTAVELVTADGRWIRTDADADAELFWAVRGGGGNFGVVTALELALYPLDQVYAGALVFDWDRAGEVLAAWRDWLEQVPEETTSTARLVQLPPTEAIPDPLRGRAFATVEAVHLGAERDGAALLAPLRALDPQMDTFAVVAPAQIGELHPDPTEPVAYRSDSRLLAELSDAALDAIVATAGPGSGSPLLSVELRHLGGALARGGDDHGALDRIDAPFLLVADGLTPDAASREAVDAHLARVATSVAPHAAGRLPAFSPDPVDPASAFPAATARRLGAVKARIDPHWRLHTDHPIPPRADE